MTNRVHDIVDFIAKACTKRARDKRERAEKPEVCGRVDSHGEGSVKIHQ